MYANREYDTRSADALDQFRQTVAKKKEENIGQSKILLNKWFAFNELVNKSNFDESKTYDVKRTIENIDLVDMTNDSIEDMEVDLHTNSINKCKSQEEKNYESIAEQLLEEFKTDSDTNIYFLENVLFKSPGFGKICTLLIPIVPTSTVLNISKAFCLLDKLLIEEHCKKFYSCFLLPTILSHDSSKEIECSLFECLEKADYTSVCSLVLLPILLKSTASCLLNVSFVTKISQLQKQFLLKEYLENYTGHFPWTFPILLSLYTSTEPDNGHTVNDLIADYLLKGSVTYQKDINFAKILHAVVVNVCKKDFSPNMADLIIKLKKTTQENMTAFKNKCLSILEDIVF